MTDKLLPEVIEPQSLKIAEAYIANGCDSRITSIKLDVPIEKVDAELKKREVKQYVDRMFFEAGFRNRDRMFGLMDQLINQKIDEMLETGLGSNADIMEIIKAYHKMKMDERKLDVEEAKVQAASGSIGKQTNIQNNISMPGSGDSNYMDLITRLSGGK